MLVCRMTPLTFVLAFVVSDARAAQIPVNFTGSITSVTVDGVASSLGGIDVGDSFSGFFVYDTNATLLYSDSQRAIYRMSDFTAISLIIDGMPFQGKDTFAALNIFNDVVSSESDNSDLFAVQQEINLPSGWSTTSPSGTTATAALLDAEGIIFDDLSVPNSIALTDFDLGEIELHLPDLTVAGSGVEPALVLIKGGINIVPEPSSLAMCGSLLMVGLVVFLFRKRGPDFSAASCLAYVMREHPLSRLRCRFFCVRPPDQV
jgi:hypothetical protein